MAEKYTPGIGRSGTFLYEIDETGRANLWSGKLEANNGNSPGHVLKAAVLFVSAHELLAALQALVGEYGKQMASMRVDSPRRELWSKACAAIVNATETPHE